MQELRNNTSTHKHNPVENMPVYRAGIHGNATIQSHSSVHVHVDWSKPLTLSNHPPIKTQIVDNRATTHTYTKPQNFFICINWKSASSKEACISAFEEEVHSGQGNKPHIQEVVGSSLSLCFLIYVQFEACEFQKILHLKSSKDLQPENIGTFTKLR